MAMTRPYPFRWKDKLKNIARWFIVREKYRWKSIAALRICGTMGQGSRLCRVVDAAGRFPTQRKRD